MNFKVGIIGPGALGLLVGSRLHRGGIATVLIDHQPARATTLQKHGVMTERGEGGSLERAHLPIVCGLDELTEIPELLILCVKATQTETVAQQLAAFGFENSVLTLQNGWGNTEMLAKHLSTASIFAGVTSDGARRLSPGRIQEHGRGHIIAGRTQKGLRQNLSESQLKSIFESGDLKLTQVENVLPYLWAKLISNVGINAITALMNLKNGQLLESPKAHRMMVHLVEEAKKIVDEKGIALPNPNPVRMVENVCKNTSENYSSMHQDLSRGRRTEIQFINGAIVREGGQLGIACPYNEAVTEMITELERWNTFPREAQSTYPFASHSYSTPWLDQPTATN